MSCDIKRLQQLAQKAPHRPPDHLGLVGRECIKLLHAWMHLGHLAECPVPLGLQHFATCKQHAAVRAKMTYSVEAKQALSGVLCNCSAVMLAFAVHAYPIAPPSASALCLVQCSWTPAVDKKSHSVCVWATELGAKEVQRGTAPGFTPRVSFTYLCAPSSRHFAKHTLCCWQF